MSYDARRGITTYQDVADPAVAEPAPSTATTPAPAAAAPVPAQSVFAPAAPSPYDRAAYDAFVAAGGNSGWALSHNMGPVEYLVANGIPLPPQVYDGILNWVNSNSGVGGVAPGSPDAALWNKFVAAVQDRESGGGHGFLGTGISTGNDSLDNALGYAQGAMWAGNMGGAALTGGDLGDAVLSDALALGGATIAPTVSTALGGGMLGAVGAGAASGALGSFGPGDNDFLTGAAIGGLTGGAIRGGGELYAALTAPEAAAPSTATALANSAPAAEGFDPLKRGMLGGSTVFDPLVLAQADTGTLSDAGVNYLTGEGVDTGAGRITGFSVAPGAYDLPVNPVNYLTGVGVDTGSGRPSTGYSTAPGAYTEFAPTGMLPPSTIRPDETTDPSTPQAETPEQREARIQQASKTVEKLTKLGSTLASMHGGQSAPQDAPSRTRTNADGTQEQLNDADYSQQLAQYALPPDTAQALADAGLTPGTPEYYQAVMDRLDATIQQVLGNTDPDAPDLADQLRGKSEEELLALERALYVRGQIGELMGSGTYTDPVTGTPQDVVVPEGKKVQPGVAAYHRGLARTTDEIAQMRPEEARRFVGGMLGRDPDLFSLQARANERALAEALASQDSEYFFDDPRRRRGYDMPADWGPLIDLLSTDQLRRLLAGFGG